MRLGTFPPLSSARILPEGRGCWKAMASCEKLRKGRQRQTRVENYAQSEIQCEVIEFAETARPQVATVRKMYESRTRLERRQTMLTGGVPEFQSLGDLLGHANVVARHFQRHIRRKRRRSSLRITHALVKCRKRRPRTDDAQIDRPAPR